ncbi:leptin receptor isoform X2 [Conger conger]|uniref:leptin receptor isoform X2 n=1 Tax=Conger conger TaxID=82655 RepID=UPI002A598E69|nr:leptin receptor isoform X2 [Conger conger]
MSFSTKGTFLLCLTLALHSVLGLTLTDGSPGQLLGTPWAAVLCCELAEHAHSPPCHINLHSSSLESPNHLPSRGVVCLNILCWVDGNAENVICNLKLDVGLSDTSRPIAVSLQRLPSQLDSDNVTDSGARDKCEGRDVQTCSVALHSVNSTVSLMISVSDGSSSVQSPAMEIVPLSFLKPNPPLDLEYHMTTEGELRLSWTHAPPSTEHFVYDIRYSSQPLHSWMRMGAEGAPGVYLKGLNVGLNYTVQVRCKTPGNQGVWSDWSRRLYVYLNEVSYIPERLFTSTGSNVTIYCIFNNPSHNANNAVWWLSYQKVPETQYTIINDHVSSVTLLNVKPLKQRGYDILHCCQRDGEKSLCSVPYAQIYVKDLSVAISCEVNGELTAMTCTWNTSQWAEVRCLYQRYPLPCEEEMELPPAEECPVLGWDSKSCSLQPLFLTSCYIMWVEGRKTEGAVKSQPVYFQPIDLVKPHPPFDLGAISLPDAYLSIWWKRPELPVYELQFEVRYSVDKDDTLQKVIRSVFNQSAIVPVVDPCGVYTIQVRCKRLTGPGFWSDWSSPYYSTVNNIKAPEQGPDFWRMLQEYPKLNQTNVTLLFKLSQSEHNFCCVEGLTIKHQTSRGSVWLENLDRVSTYTFSWTEDAHTVTVLAHNALGSSTKNSYMTLARGTKSQSVHSFNSVMVNSSCVAFSWTLFPNSSAPSSFVIEWSAQSRSRQHTKQGERVKWVRVPPYSRAFHLHETFFATEEYQFTLYPIFENGEGEPIYAKDRGRPRGDHAAYVLLLIIAFLSVVLFVTLAVSQNQMRKLVWKDVPNPNNCSWAQGVDFRKAETIESLFRHPERLISCPLLLESETISEAVIVETTGSKVQDNERDQVLDKAGEGDEASTLAPCQNPEEPPVQETSVSPSSPDGSAQSRISYAMVLFPETPGLLYKQQESLSSSSDEGNFSANNSDISGSFPGGLWELENPPSNESGPRHSCCYNSAEEFSEPSDQEDDVLDGTGAGKQLYYLGMTSQDEEEDEDDKQDEDDEEEKVVRFPAEDAEALPLESNPLLGRWDPRLDRTDVVAQSPPLYVPQFRTASKKSQQAKGVPPGLKSSEQEPVC